MRVDRFDLHGKVALITGASSGLGAHFASVLSTAGADVILAARRLSALEDVAAGLKGNVRTLRLDVSNVGAVDRAIADAGVIDILINNAGVVQSAAALDQSEAQWNAVVDINLKGMFFVAQSVIKEMRKNERGGSIVNVASILGLRQAGAVLPYGVSKAGVLQMTKILALEVARYGVRVNALAPGYVATDLNRDFFESAPGQEMIRRIPQRRLANLEDLDGPLLLLASDASRYMTGSTLVVDGGHVISTL